MNNKTIDRKNMTNIGAWDHCYGCTGCAAMCPQDIISIQERDGFLEPVITSPSKCTECAICLKVCSFNSDILKAADSISPEYYAAYSTEDMTRNSCTSGGAVYEICKAALKCGYKIIAVRYNYDINRPEHFVLTSIDDLGETRGSKYLQSNLAHTIKSLSRQDKYLIIGTPCQISTVRNIMRLKKMEENVVLIDFFCHGVPSAELWDQYLADAQKITGDVKRIYFRPKDFGWHNSTRVKVVGDRAIKLSPVPDKDIFFDYFLGNRCLSKACYDDCVFKQLSSSADLRVGDLWGGKYMDNEQGVSGVLALSVRGLELLKASETLFISKEDSGTVLNAQMKKNAKRAPSYRVATFCLRHSISLRLSHALCSGIDFIYSLPNRVWRKIKSL